VGNSKTIRNTEVILVVKGAGLHKADDTLDLFLRGFWPAVTSVDPKATITQRSDIFPPDFCSSPHAKDPSHHMAEIVARGSEGKKRIWVREAYWEDELKPENPLRVLSNEWHMASYAFGSMIFDWLSGFDTVKRRKNRLKPGFHWLAYFLMYLAVVLPSLILAYWNETLRPLPSTLLLGVGLALLVSAVSAIRPASAALRFQKTRDKNKRRQLPGMGTWILIPLLAAFLINPARYLLFLLGLGAIELVVLYGRQLAWPRRAVANSDTDTLYYYKFGDKIRERFGRRHKKSTKVCQLLYRYIVVLGLPLTFPIVLLAKLLKLIPTTPMTRGIWVAVDNVLNVVFSSVLGDVVSYAMNPTQAHRVRSVIAKELEFFHDHPEVSGIHLFAHSQGTPITFETLFHHLPEPYRAKIKSYVTVGSVLSYYKQANPVLDNVYQKRFPGFPYPGGFHKDFRWINCWNLHDPITEFFALDEYNMITDAPRIEDMPRKIDPNKHKKLIERIKRHRVSPRNVRTTGTSLIWKSHFEYWTNLDQVQIPFARRVLGKLRPEGWNTLRDRKHGHARSYGFWLFLSMLGVALLAAVVAWLLYLLWDPVLTGWLTQANEVFLAPAMQKLDQAFGISEAIGEENIVATVRDVLEKFVEWWRTKEAGRLREFLITLIVGLTLILSGLPAVIELLLGGRDKQTDDTVAT
jgi:pimeloyl-ACP methyl ester carboxylesterase